MLDASVLLLGVGVSLVVYLGLRALIRASTQPLPPGPRGLPILGNLKDLPPPGAFEAHHWLKHKALYGPISSITVLGQTIVIVNEAALAFEILERRSAIHSSRPNQIFAGEMVGWRDSLAFLPYSARFRTYRKNMSRIIGSNTAASQYDKLQEAEVAHFLLHVLDQPDKLKDHAGAVILKIAYGYTAEQFEDDVLVDMAGEAMNNFAVAAVPGAFLVDIMPFLRHVPDWVPGTGWKRLAREWGSELQEVVEKPYAFVKHQLAQGKQDSSFLTHLLDAGDATAEEKLANKWSAASLYVAGADTTVSSVACFFLAMSLHPEVQKKAQEEIDRVVGRDRIPASSDRQRLPYIEAVVKEVLRWHPVAPMGLPHSGTADDICEGYFIPKEAMVLANIWHFTHDPEVYQEPMRFNPERFLPADGRQSQPDPYRYVFGFGRRICPGRVLADNAMYLTIAQTLAVFSISKDEAEAAEEIRFTPGIVSHPAPFNAVIKPRSEHHEKLVRALEQVYPWEKSDGHVLESIQPE
ncbi:hypothetical protein F66182_8618 [Fusarium sp. NRRL 66182]|nr:hypothetical protein F66182_8618 [Fusarium sp. NRRL 66182]